MRPTLEEALAAVAGDDAATGPESGTANVEGDAQPSGQPMAGTVADALAAYERGQRALGEGDWSEYGEAQAELERILETLARSSGVPVVPEPEPPLAGTPVP
jgi:hypothetical protein